jgi:hypothetical protein
MKEFAIVVAGVLVGAWIWSKMRRRSRGPVAGAKAAATEEGASMNFSGYATDAKTGAYLPPGAKSGTVGFSSDNIVGVN